MVISINTDVFRETTGILKLIALGIAILNLAFTAEAFYEWEWMEEIYLAFIIIFFIISFISLICSVLGVLKSEGFVIRLEFAYHCAVAVIILITGFLFFISLIDNPKHRMWARVLSLLTGMLNSWVNGLIAFVIFRTY